MAQKRMYEIGDFRLDCSARILLRGGQVVPLHPKTVDTLILLVEHNGELVGKDELVRTVWADSFVTENSITKNISILRKTLGGGDGEERYIETVPKRGYRFVGTVREIAHESHVQPAADPPSTPKPKWKLWSGAALLAAVAGAIIFLFAARPAIPPPLKPIVLTSLPGNELRPSLSPDGSLVA